MRKLLIISLIFTFIPINSFSQDKFSQDKIDEMRKDIAVIKEKLSSVNQRIDDLDKRLSQRIDDLDKKLNQRIDDVRGEIRDLKNIMLSGFGILLSGMFVLVGFVIWDRRTALAPAIKEIEVVKEKEKIIEETLKIYAQKNIEFKKAMETTGLIPTRA